MKCCCEHTEGFPEICECKKEIIALTDANHFLMSIYKAAQGLSKISLESDAKTALKEACIEYEKWRSMGNKDFKYRYPRR